MPEPDGLTLGEAERCSGIPRGVHGPRGRGDGRNSEPGNVEPLTRLAAALGL